jgi:DNA-binding transcriptional ArsR family regulator
MPQVMDAWQALADPTRRSVYARVATAPSSVSEIAHGLPVSRPAVSQHLRVLLDSRLVDVTRRGREQVYRARPEGLDAMRTELEAFWRGTLTSLKVLAELTYEAHDGGGRR